MPSMPVEGLGMPGRLGEVSGMPGRLGWKINEGLSLQGGIMRD